MNLGWREHQPIERFLILPNKSGHQTWATSEKANDARQIGQQYQSYSSAGKWSSLRFQVPLLIYDFKT
jgi:hypothetical protein